MKSKMRIAQNNGRYYRVSLQQMRYFPIAKKEAEALLASGEAVETAYLPFGRQDIYRAYQVAQEAIRKAQKVKSE